MLTLLNVTFLHLRVLFHFHNVLNIYLAIIILAVIHLKMIMRSVKKVRLQNHLSLPDFHSLGKEFLRIFTFTYRISANSFRGNYSFLNLALFTVTFDLYFINLNSCRGNYSREESIQGRKLFAEIRYMSCLKT